MPAIKQLPASAVNKIAAGEVIERPASVIKELLENSVDAGASRIEVSIEKGGLDLMRVTDNGHGIAGDQLEMAVTSHATSKISSADDLFCVGTLGFRGEALASIAEVSQMLIRSRSLDQETGYEFRVNGGIRETVAPCSSAVGTSVEVCNLFFNTPVRRKFLKTTQTEMGHIGEAFTRIALARPDIHLVLTHNGRTVHELPVTGQWAERVTNFFGSEIGDALIPIGSQDGPIRVSGFVVDPSHSRGNNRMQYLFLNGRFIRDRALQHALGEAFRGLLMTGRYPIAFLQLDMPAELVDVNVHPAKLEVRFQESSRLYSQLLGAIRNKFLTTDLTARAQLNPPPAMALAGAGNSTGATSAEPRGVGPDASTAAQQETIDLTTHRVDKDWTSLPDARPGSGLAAHSDRSETRTWNEDRSVVGPPREPSESGGRAPEPGQFGPAPAGARSPQSAEGKSPVRASMRESGARALQIHHRYLITESEEGMVIIDQHALHERIIYEHLRKKVLSGKLESQKLLVPEPVPLASAEAAEIIESQQVLAQIGIDVEPFGGDTVLVSAYPAMLTNHNPAEMLHDVVEMLMAENKPVEARDVIDELLHMISCKAAVKAGDPLSDDEISALLEHRQLCQDAHHCPHGRPTALVFSREELDRRFKRI